jgi:hypothetical protein
VRGMTTLSVRLIEVDDRRAKEQALNNFPIS